MCKFVSPMIYLYILGNTLATSKGLVTPRDHGFLLIKNQVIEEILKFFFANIYYFE